jgi:PPOX class probable F420-dependent enzyme
VFDNSRGGRSGSDAGLDHLRDTKTIVLTTFKRDGTPVPTPVSIAFDGSRAFFRSYHKAWKTKRLSRNPEVEVTPSNVSGKVTGPSVRAWAKLLDDQQSRVAARALARRHRFLQALLVPVAHRLMRYKTMHYELLPPTDGLPPSPERGAEGAGSPARQI